MDKTKVGEWEKLFEFANVPVHASLLPNGKVLYWGRRANPMAKPPATDAMNETSTTTYIWDPSDPTQASRKLAAQPMKHDKTGPVNLFCSGHCFQADGTLLVVGGHEKDGVGLPQACVFNPADESWTAKPPMVTGRWYPSALTLADGRVLAISGSTTDYNPDRRPQIWHVDDWVDVSLTPRALYPRMHLFNSRVFITGPNKSTQFLDPIAKGTGVSAKNIELVGAWTDGPDRAAGHREYAPSVMYDTGKIIYIGGGNDPNPHDDINGGDINKWLPSKQTETIDLTISPLKWSPAADMKRNRQQHNGTVLPDGTVLVTGGTEGGGFNNLDKPPKLGPVHTPELWDPATGAWNDMAPEDLDRCYHSIALLLPDGRVLSAGGGEFNPAPNPDVNITRAQLFKPPYFFKEGGKNRPNVSGAPANVTYGKDFGVNVGPTDAIDRASWVRLGSVTHACNFNQSLMFLKTKQTGTTVTVSPPKDAKEAPPGHYMLFLLTKTNIPCVKAPIISIGPGLPLPPKPQKVAPGVVKHMVATQRFAVSNAELDQQIIREQARPAVTVGLTPLCYYGLGPCWSGAHDGLGRISDIAVVRPMPSQADSVAFVYLKEDVVPDIDVWMREFQATANGAYVMRGIDMTLSGVVTKRSDQKLTLKGTNTRPDVLLEPFQASDQILWDKDTKTQKPVTEKETGAYARLSAALADHPEGLKMQVTGRLRKVDDNNFSVHVREFET